MVQPMTFRCVAIRRYVVEHPDGHVFSFRVGKKPYRRLDVDNAPVWNAATAPQSLRRSTLSSLKRTTSLCRKRERGATFRPADAGKRKPASAGRRRLKVYAHRECAAA